MNTDNETALYLKLIWEEKEEIGFSKKCLLPSSTMCLLLPEEINKNFFSEKVNIAYQIERRLDKKENIGTEVRTNE